MTIERLARLSDDRLLVSTGPYGNLHLFDPANNSYKELGSPASSRVYDLLQMDGRIFFGGYPNGVLGEFRNRKAVVVGHWHDTLGSKHTFHLVQGADGRIYAGNHHERESTGGALGWYDPTTQELGGIHFPNDDCESLTTAVGGTLVIYASDYSVDPTKPQEPRNGKLIVYDTTQQKVVRELEPLSDPSAGVVVETDPGILVGVGLHQSKPVAYRIDVRSGQLLQRRDLPDRAYRSIARGPDGQAYVFIDDTLARIDPASLELEPLVQAEPGRMVFVGDDLYIGGRPQLRRITSMAAR